MLYERGSRLTHIAILARPWVADLYAREAVCDRVIPYTPRCGTRRSGGEVAHRAELAKEGFRSRGATANSFESAMVARLAGISRIVGYNRDGADGCCPTRFPPQYPPA